MEVIGINFGFLFVQLLSIALLIGLPIVSLIDLSKKKLSGAALALWALLICAVPLLGALAYWIVKPTPEIKN
ncbi:MAG: hypothetical protein HXY42_05320 [Chloroflexi bacterium]|nr:hypothetical protein [Chloroflexota bacterium]